MRLTLALLGLAALMPGCATILAGGPDPVSFDSTPRGATVTLDGVVVGETPCQALVSRQWDKGHLVFEHAGETVEMWASRTFNGAFLGNILIGGVLGMLIDLGSGNVRKSKPFLKVNFATKTGESITLVEPPTPKAIRDDPDYR